MRNTMLALACHYDQLFSSYAQILGKNDFQSCQKWYWLNFDDRFEDQENSSDLSSSKLNEFDKTGLYNK